MTIDIDIDGVAYRLKRGASLLDLAADEDLNISFGCFSGRCGFCRVEIIAGAENLGSRTDLEEVYFDQMGGSSNERLACQCRPTGPVSLRALPQR